MNKILLSVICLFLINLAHAQSTHDVMIGGGLDVIKTDIQKVFDKAQIGVEANYFVVRHFSVGGGAEFWSNHDSFVMGVRWYANEHFFARFRGLIGANDASVGAGWSKPFANNFRLEVIGDYYFHGDLALRTGVAFIIK
jgi:hypothetical protein